MSPAYLAVPSTLGSPSARRKGLPTTCNSLKDLTPFPCRPIERYGIIVTGSDSSRVLSNLLQPVGRKPSSTHLVALSIMATWIDLCPVFELGRDLLGHWRIEVSDIFRALDHDLPVGQRLETLAIASHLTFLLILPAPGAD